MRHLLSACLLTLCSVAHAEVIDIDNAQLEKLIQSGVPVIDIRLQREWEETGIVAGSKLLTFFDAQGRHDAAGWLEKVKPFAKPNEPVIVICRTGNRTKPVSQFLSQQAGYTTVYNVKHGIKGWIGAGGAVEPATQSIASCKAGKTC
jgi:rhodanese-related sulfurtransferase